MMEIWKDIQGYEGLYQISNTGKVRSLSYMKTGSTKILKQGTNGKGYKQINLNKNGKCKNYKIHRLVAEAFLENPNNYPIINHKDENPSNNNVENLEWCTIEYNNNYGTRNERVSKANKGKKLSEDTKNKISESHKKKVQCINNRMIFDTVTEAAKWSNSHRSCIAKQIKGKRNTAGRNPVTGEKLRWKYLG